MTRRELLTTLIAAIAAPFAPRPQTSTISDAETFVYQDQGHVFYYLRFDAPTTHICLSDVQDGNRW